MGLVRKGFTGFRRLRRSTLHGVQYIMKRLHRGSRVWMQLVLIVYNHSVNSVSPLNASHVDTSYSREKEQGARKGGSVVEWTCHLHAQASAAE